ncbi:hypothetical protein KP509_38G054100 [Ceratopteris richardii]|uniref:Uncharacterized protein n=1 Tax=Ceratopteris richardii TaxID=49495 RepID=A0A8T2Q574_CERRI|nr:hypothetical protein KP509_38G054100 [Ceratopteris richardii]
MASTIHDAARAGDLVRLLSIIEADASTLNSRDRHSRTPLHLASWAGHTDVVHALCKKNADVGATAVDNTAAIHFASQKGHVEVVRMLLAAGASATASTRKGMTPLHYAIQGGHLELAKLLMKRGACLHTKNKAGKKPVDLIKDEEFLRALQAAETKTQTAKSRPEMISGKSEASLEIEPEESKDYLECGRIPDPNKKNDKDDSLEVSTSQVDDTSPSRKKIKVQLSHLDMEHEHDTVSDEMR